MKVTVFDIRVHRNLFNKALDSKKKSKPQQDKVDKHQLKIF